MSKVILATMFAIGAIGSGNSLSMAGSEIELGMMRGPNFIRPMTPIPNNNLHRVQQLEPIFADCESGHSACGQYSKDAGQCEDWERICYMYLGVIDMCFSSCSCPNAC